VLALAHAGCTEPPPTEAEDEGQAADEYLSEELDAELDSIAERVRQRGFSPADDPWPPTDPVQGGQCDPGSQGAGEDYQELSILTGGLRFPLCNNDSFDMIFRHIARDVISGVALACSFAPERPPGGETPDFDRVVVVYEPGPGLGSPRSLRRVADASACDSGDYYVVDGAIELCPMTCDLVEMDEMGSLAVHVACEQLCGNGEIDGFEECDDGNRDDGDGCSATCTDEII